MFHLTVRRDNDAPDGIDVSLWYSEVEAKECKGSDEVYTPMKLGRRQRAYLRAAVGLVEEEQAHVDRAHQNR